jgi:4-hydroxy-4-methyl-2-oxoglutarate aldolase
MPATVAADAAGPDAALPSWVRPVGPGQYIAARAEPVWIQRDDNSGLTQLIASGTRGDGAVLVVGGGSESRAAVIGDVMASELRAAGFTGMITDGPVRDSAELRRLTGFPVWSRGLTSFAPRKLAAPPAAGFVVIGGVPVVRGDLVVADDDGVVVWASAQVSALAAKAVDKDRADRERLAKIPPYAPGR